MSHINPSTRRTAIDTSSPILGLPPEALRERLAPLGLPKYAPAQIQEWLYKKFAASYQSMTNLSLASRAALEEGVPLGLSAPLEEHVSEDGTRKYLFGVGGNSTVEAALIPDKERATLCLSTQVGCKQGCAFCATGKQHFTANLAMHQILNQLFSLPNPEAVTNVVFMGMGEPLDNLEALLGAIATITASWGLAWSPKRVTVSTIGIRRPLETLLARTTAHVAISLHTPFQTQRDQLMPGARRLPIEQLMRILKEHHWHGQRRLSFEYVLLRGVNDSMRHCEAVAKLLKGMECLVNLISYHPHSLSPFARPEGNVAISWREALNARGIRATVRESRGMDIEAACGLLSRTAANRVNQ